MTPRYPPRSLVNAENRKGRRSCKRTTHFSPSLQYNYNSRPMPPPPPAAPSPCFIEAIQIRSALFLVRCAANSARVG